MQQQVLRSLVSAGILALAVIMAPNSNAVAFTGAQGYGANATGGSTVYHVTNLNDTGTGSFRTGVGTSGRRIVFDLAGTIHLASEVAVSNNTTIDGTTAPGGRITITGQPVSISNRNNVIVRSIRFREDTTGPSGKDAFQGTNCFNFILDHCSIEWGRWDCMEFTSNSHDFTVQNCIIGAGIDPQYFAFLVDSCTNVSVHHNLFIDCESRNPKGKANMQYINNAVYNWGGGGCYVGGHSSAAWYVDMINNYFIAGPSSTANWLSQCTSTDHIYFTGNNKDLDKNGTRNGTTIPGSEVTAQTATLEPAAHNFPPVAVTVNSNTYTIDQALAGALGCTPNDSVDTTLIGYVRSYGTQGHIGK